jgi:hypothetical protein
MDQLALGTFHSSFLASDDGSYEIACERAAGVDGDVVFFAEGADFLGVVEVTDDDAVGFKAGFELALWLGAADVGGYRPVRVRLLDGSYVRRLKMRSQLCSNLWKVRCDHIPPMKPEAP